MRLLAIRIPSEQLYYYNHLVELDKVMFFSEGLTAILSKDKRGGNVMHNVYTIICAGLISFAGLTAHAQPLPNFVGFGGSQPLANGEGTSISETMQGVVGQLTEAAVEQVTVLEGPLVLETEVPEVNQRTVDFIDSQTGRYPPKLKIDLTEFPLRSLTDTSRSHNGRSVQTGTPTEMIVQRIQDRLRIPQFSLTVEDRTAIISGKVTTERQRSLIESMLRFEPGISAVRNEMTIISDQM